MIYQNVLDAMGNTPMIQLNRIVPKDAARILVKYEGLNVGGSIKTRVAYNMVMEAVRAGKITKDTVIVEPTSGNQGIGLGFQLPNPLFLNLAGCFFHGERPPFYKPKASAVGWGWERRYTFPSRLRSRKW